MQRVQAADGGEAEDLQARLASTEAWEREQAAALYACQQERAALQVQLASREAQHQQAVCTWEAGAEAREQEQAALQSRLAAAEACGQEQAAALQAASRQVECLQAQLDRQAGELQQERGSWLALAGRLQAMAQGTASKQVSVITGAGALGW